MLAKKFLAQLDCLFMTRSSRFKEEITKLKTQFAEIEENYLSYIQNLENKVKLLEEHKQSLERSSQEFSCEKSNLEGNIARLTSHNSNLELLLKKKKEMAQERISAAMKESFGRSRTEGVQDCIRKVFATQHGQAFLKRLQIDLIEGYKFSRPFYKFIQKDVTHFVRQGFNQGIKYMVDSQGKLPPAGKIPISAPALPPVWAKGFRNDSDVAWEKAVVKKAVMEFISDGDLDVNLPPAASLDYTVSDLASQDESAKPAISSENAPSIPSSILKSAVNLN